MNQESLTLPWLRLAGEEETSFFFQLGSAAFTGCESSPFWSPNSVYGGFCSFIFFFFFEQLSLAIFFSHIITNHIPTLLCVACIFLLIRNYSSHLMTKKFFFYDLRSTVVFIKSFSSSQAILVATTFLVSQNFLFMSSVH